MTELKPCPFCGGKADWFVLEKMNNEKLYYVECSYCFARTGYYFTEYESIKEWNKRTPDWISVNGRVPCETSNKWCVGVNSCGKMFAFKESLACNPKSDTWLIPTALFNAEEITHFMYLPEPLKGE